MKKKTRAVLAAGGVFLAMVGATLAAPGCQSTAPDAKSGNQLWAENCGRCHNVRSPTSYSDAEWDVAMHHMRVRANLTAEEYRKILEFLKASN